MIKTRVTAELVEEAISSQEGDADADVQEFVMILDHKNVPISIYDPVRKVFDRKCVAPPPPQIHPIQIGRASCRERV